jgi:ubiquitin C-terminal hydrolase
MQKKTKQTRTKQRGTRKTKFVKTRTKVCPVPVLPNLGLGNLGNTCFINAVLQVFLRLYFAGLLVFYSGQVEEVSETKAEIKESQELQLALAGLFTSPHGASLNSAANKNVRKHCIFPSKKADAFMLGRQQDATELLVQLLKIEPFLSSCQAIICTHNYDRKRPITTSELNVAYDYHRLLSERTYRVDIGLNSVTFERTNKIDLSIQNTDGTENYGDLDTCFAEYFHAGLLETPIQGKEGFLQQVKVYQWPQVLVVCLKRYHYDNETGKTTKLSHFVHVPERMDRDGHTFLLHGVVYHHGTTPTGGHYVSDVRNSAGEWFHYDDSTVTQLPSDELFNDPAKYEDADDRYILVYLKQ